MILTPVSIFLGVSTALVTNIDILLVDVFFVFVGGLCAHISVNAFNEYFDFHSGLDAVTSKTSFSGGSGALIDDPKAAGNVFLLASVCLTITILIGFYFNYSLGSTILPIGVAGILIIITYTQWLNRYPILCLIAPGLGFGPLMVVGTHVVLTGGHSVEAFHISLIPFFLTNNLLLLNQIPDIAADTMVGRKHLPIAYGLSKSILVYGLFVVATGVIITTGIFKGILPKLSYISLTPLLAAVIAYIGALKFSTNIEKLIPFLGLNVVAATVTPTLLGLVLIFG